MLLCTSGHRPSPVLICITTQPAKISIVQSHLSSSSVLCKYINCVFSTSGTSSQDHTSALHDPLALNTVTANIHHWITIVLSLQVLLRASDYATFALYASSCLLLTMLDLLLPIETKGRSMKVRIAASHWYILEACMDPCNQKKWSFLTENLEGLENLCLPSHSSECIGCPLPLHGRLCNHLWYKQIVCFASSQLLPLIHLCKQSNTGYQY